MQKRPFIVYKINFLQNKSDYKKTTFIDKRNIRHNQKNNKEDINGYILQIKKQLN